MNPDAATLWRAPRWVLAFLLACLGMLGPFSIDTYLPAFTGIAQSIGATPVYRPTTCVISIRVGSSLHRCRSGRCAGGRPEADGLSEGGRAAASPYTPQSP